MKIRISILSTIIALFAASAAFAGPPPGGWTSANDRPAMTEARSDTCESCQPDAAKKHAHMEACHSEAVACPACETETQVVRRGAPSRSGGSSFARVTRPAGECSTMSSAPKHAHCA